MFKKIIFAIAIFLAISQGGDSMALELRSPAFKHNEFIPKDYTCQGQDISPRLNWLGVPEGTKSFVLICDDPDAPMGTWVHWVVYDIPANLNSIPESVEREGILKGGIKQGVTDFGRVGYGGPCPPPGKPHHYFFKLYALDKMLNLKPGLTKSEVLKEIEGHVLEETALIGLYRR